MRRAQQKARDYAHLIRRHCAADGSGNTLAYSKEKIELGGEDGTLIGLKVTFVKPQGDLKKLN